MTKGHKKSYCIILGGTAACEMELRTYRDAATRETNSKRRRHFLSESNKRYLEQPNQSNNGKPMCIFSALLL